MKYILYILLKKFKVYYTSIRSARYVFVFLQSKFLKEKSSGFQSEFGVRGFNPVTGQHIRYVHDCRRGPRMSAASAKSRPFFSYFFPFHLKSIIIYFLSYMALERLKIYDSNDTFLNQYNHIHQEILTKNHGNLRDSLS